MKAKVLIVDDDAETRNAIRLTLESGTNAAYEFRSADTVPAGLKAVDTFKPDVMILDLHLPGENGFDLLDKLDEHRLPKSKVVMLTADNSLKNLWQAETKGINAYHFMGKPFEGDELRALILSLALTP